jgi:hypothetical protein
LAALRAKRQACLAAVCSSPSAAGTSATIRCISNFGRWPTIIYSSSHRLVSTHAVREGEE